MKEIKDGPAIAAVSAYGAAAKGMTLDDHVVALANLSANLALAVYEARLKSGYAANGARALAHELTDQVAAAARQILDGRLAEREEALNAGAGKTAKKILTLGQFQKRQAAEAMAKAALNGAAFGKPKK